MTQNEIALGRVVISKAGRDSGRTFIIIGTSGDNYVLIADGRTHRVDRPKKKKLMHLKVGELRAEEISAKLLKETKISDAEVRKALSALGYNTDEE